MKLLSKHNQDSKTLGPQSSHLILSLYDRQQPIFRLADAQEILERDRNATQQVVFELVQKGVISRLGAGLYRLVPFELGFEKEYLGNPFVVGRELVRGRSKSIDTKYYISHGSAFEFHQMATQPQLATYVTSPRLIRSRVVLGTEFRFIRCKPSDLFGFTEVWIEKTEKIQISDVERTLIDGLKQPEYCGGISEVAKGFFMRRESVDPKKLVDYAIRLDVGAVIRRLGFLMELFFDVKISDQLERLQSQLTATYSPLDPSLPMDGKFISKWRLCLNVSKEELLSLVRT